MCPPYRSNPRTRVISQQTYDDWSETALCAIALFYRNRENNAILCDECHADDTQPALFDRVYRHYLHIGTNELLEECSECYVIIPMTRAYPDCQTCIRVLDGFIAYLQESGINPHENPQPHLIAIDQIVTPYQE